MLRRFLKFFHVQPRTVSPRRGRPLYLEQLEDRLVPSSNSPFKVFGTGLDTSGHLLADGAADPHYAILSGPSTAAPVELPQGGFPFPYWSADDARSGWITPGDALNNAGNGYQEPEGDYVYQTTFDLTGYNSATAAIAGLIGADNTVTQVLLNGQDAGYTPTNVGNNFGSLNALNITSGFVSGMNTLDFVVHNDPGDSFNPTGFRAELSGTAQLAGTPFAALSTGVDDAGNLLSDGATDPHWQLVSAPAPDATGSPYVTIQNGYPFPYWTADGPNSKWISPNANENDFAGGATDPVGNYTYETTFDLTGFDPSTARIAGLVSADNTLEQVLLNGQDVSYTSSGGNDYTGLHSLEISSGFVAGVNTLDFVVYNAPIDPNNLSDNAHNPSAFRAELSGTGTPAPEAVDDGYSVLHDQSLTVAAAGVLANDSEAGMPTLTAHVLSDEGPSHGALTLNTDGSFTYTPEAGYVGGDSFEYVASDGVRDSQPATVSITVLDDPAGQPDSYSTLQGQALTVDTDGGVLANDEDPTGNGLTAVLGTGPGSGTLDLQSDGGFVYTPNVGFHGADSFTYLANDGLSDSAPVLVRLTVISNAPLASDDAYSVAAGQTLSVAGPGVLANDYVESGDALAAQLVTTPSNGSLALNPDGSFQYVPNAGFTGNDSFTYWAYDSQSNTHSNVATASILVTDVAAATTVSVQATQPYAYDGDPPLSGEFAITRMGDLGADLAVSYRLSGTAVNGVDYETLSGAVTIAAGFDTALIDVNPLLGPGWRATRSVILTLVPTAAYQAVALASSAAVSIAPEAMAQIDPVTSGTKINPDGPINQIINPAGIVIEANPTAQNVAIIKITNVIQGLDNLGADDNRVTWTIEGVADPVAGNGAAKFFVDPTTGRSDNTGSTVRITGLTEGRILLTAKLTGTDTVLDTYQAIVVKERTLPFRVQLLHLGNINPALDGAMTRTIAQASADINVANVYLRQIGVRLVADTDVVTQPTTGATTLIDPETPGYFQANVDKSLVTSVTPENLTTTVRQGDHGGVVNIVYIGSLESAATNAETINYPSTSLGAATVSLKYRDSVNDSLQNTTREMILGAGKLQAGQSDVWGLVLTNRFGDPSATQLYGRGLAHEIGHILDLNHRGDDTDPIKDGIEVGKKLGQKNLMYPHQGKELDSEDLDLIQLVGARGSPALQG